MLQIVKHFSVHLTLSLTATGYWSTVPTLQDLDDTRFLWNPEILSHMVTPPDDQNSTSVRVSVANAIKIDSADVDRCHKALWCCLRVTDQNHLRNESENWDTEWCVARKSLSTRISDLVESRMTQCFGYHCVNFLKIFLLEWCKNYIHPVGKSMSYSFYLDIFYPHMFASVFNLGSRQSGVGICSYHVFLWFRVIWDEPQGLPVVEKFVISALRRCP